MPTLDSRLFVLSTQRAIMSFYASLPQGLMPKAMGIESYFLAHFLLLAKVRLLRIFIGFYFIRFCVICLSLNPLLQSCLSLSEVS